MSDSPRSGSSGRLIGPIRPPPLEPRGRAVRLMCMRKTIVWLVPLTLVAGCSQPTTTVGGVIAVSFDSTAHAEAGRAAVASSCQLTRMTRDDHYGIRAEQYYVEPRGSAARDTAITCAKRFPHVVGVSLPL